MIKEIIGNATLYCGDSNEILSEIKNVDSVVTDPPYGLSFMGKQWDYDVPQQELWEKVYQSIKQGGHLLSFFGSRTYHRGVIPIEDAGFEIRDQLMWLYGSGFPKSHNIGKAVDKLQGNEREDLGEYEPFGREGRKSSGKAKFGVKGWETKPKIRLTKGNSEYEGWGTALKPAHEPIVMARKPFKGTVANNVLEHGTGGINIDGCRVGTEDNLMGGAYSGGERKEGEWKEQSGFKNNNPNIEYEQPQGRFPANVMHDGSEEVLEIFPETGKSSGGSGISSQKSATGEIYGKYKQGHKSQNLGGLGDEGTASRYFYCAKASKKDRDEGLDSFSEKKWVQWQTGNGASGKPSSISEGRNTAYKNIHPTVKPTELMRYLCRLITPKGGVILDPFMGSGSTGKGALLEGFKFIGIEMEREYFDIACARLETVQKNSQQNLFAHKQIIDKEADGVK
tara:strand:- start:2499 stop:3851 length:1353 start_codon:yes stop_codon:yes gene_type:complete